MKRQEFRTFIQKSIEDVIRHAEFMTGMVLPRTIAFQWLGTDQPVIREGIVDEILTRVFINEEEIYPCVDFGPSTILADGTLLLRANIAGYPAAPFQKNWAGGDGPFVPCIFGALCSKTLPAHQRGAGAAAASKNRLVQHARIAELDGDIWERVARMDEFRRLLAAKKKFVVPTTIFFVVYYFALPISVGYFPEVMSKKVLGPVNLAYLFALSQFFMAWGVAWAYIRAARGFDAAASRIFDRLNEQS